jgi:hypothetical protein
MSVIAGPCFHPQDEEIGGRCASVFLDTTEGTFRFDTGPSLLIFPKVYEEVMCDITDVRCRRKVLNRSAAGA